MKTKSEKGKAVQYQTVDNINKYKLNEIKNIIALHPSV